jgi:hypothetical protein
MKHRRRSQPAESRSDRFVRRTTFTGVAAGFAVGVLAMVWVHVSDFLELTGYWAQPRWAMGFALAAFGCPFVILPIWAAFHYEEGASLFGRPVNRRDNPVTWFLGYSLFVLIGIALIALAVLIWCGRVHVNLAA